jgi:hypothetical protein
MVEHGHVIKHRVLPMIAAIIIAAIAIIVIFSAYYSAGPFQTAESMYVGKLTLVADIMRATDLQERQAIQDWKNSKLLADEAISVFTNLQAERMQIRENLKSIVAPESFQEIHQGIYDSNELWINSDSNYIQGILQIDDKIIERADAEAKNANQNFNLAIEKLRTQGFDI